MAGEKIATCCYCGTRAALILRGKVRHELSCANCGAPLHDLKMLRADHSGRRDRPKAAPVRRTHEALAIDPRRRKKKRKSLKRKLFEEAWDILEDIFD